MELLKIEIDPPDIPTPGDYKTESETTNRILHSLESSQFDPLKSSPAAYGEITPWVAYKLGCAAEGAAENREYDKALKIAWTSVKAAIEAKAFGRLYANLLTLSGILLRRGKLEEAESQYSNILELPFPGGQTERASAHISLGSILANRGATREALYHYEKGLSYLRNIIPEQAHRKLLKQLTGLYADVNDVAGLAHCFSQLGLGNPGEILQQNISYDMHVEEILFLTTRLHSLGEHELADVVFKAWKQGQDKSTQNT